MHDFKCTIPHVYQCCISRLDCFAKEQELNSAPLPALALHFVAETRQRKGSGVEEEGEETVPSGTASGCDDALHLPTRIAQDFRPL